ncbi:MAG: hypothetical protein QM703_28495 [Gemmatales bacterium]
MLLAASTEMPRTMERRVDLAGLRLGLPARGHEADLLTHLHAVAPYGIVAGPDNLETALDGQDFLVPDQQPGLAAMDYDIGDSATLTSITAYRDLYQDIAIDTDASPRQTYSYNRNHLGRRPVHPGTAAGRPCEHLRLYGRRVLLSRHAVTRRTADGGTLGLVPDNTGIIFSNNLGGAGHGLGRLRRSPSAWWRATRLFGQLEA